MTAIIVGYLLFLVLCVVCVIITDSARGKVPLFSIRNVFLVGFTLFQLTSPIYPIVTQRYLQFNIQDTSRTGLIYCLWATTFLIVFLLAYPRAPLARKAADFTPITKYTPSMPGLIMLTVTLSVMAVTLRFGVMIPLVASLAQFAAVSFAAIACGLVGWIWAPRLFNPVYALLAGSVVAVNAANVITGSFGRRELVAIMACFLWGMFYSWWRHFDPRRGLMKLAAIGTVPLLAVALYTSVRDSAQHNRSAAEHLQAVIQEGSISTGLMLLLDGQNAGGVSMWCLENFPETHPMRLGFTMRYAIMYPIPRAVWPSKPPPLAQDLPYLAGMSKVTRGRLTIGPGIIGHAAAEGGYLILVAYALIIAWVTAFLDRLVLRSMDNPMVVLPLGSALGQVLGLARGETGAFLFIMLFSIASSYFTVVFIAKVLERLFGGAGVVQHEPGDNYDYEGDAAGFSEAD